MSRKGRKAALATPASPLSVAAQAPLPGKAPPYASKQLFRACIAEQNKQASSKFRKSTLLVCDTCLTQFSKSCTPPVGAGLPANTGEARAIQPLVWPKIPRALRPFIHPGKRRALL